MCILRAVARYRTTDHKREEDIREELGVTRIKIIKRVSK
jgi:hypothetical protein